MEHPNAGSITLDLGRARGGDAAALGRVIERYQSVLERRIVRQIGRRGTELETPHELAQGVFAALGRYIATDKTWPMTVANRDSLERMMFQVLSCRLIDATRRDGAARRRGTVDEQKLRLPNGVSFSDALPADEADPADAVLAEDMLHEMQAAVAAEFPDGVPVLADAVAGFSVREIAARRGWSETRVRRAQTRIQTLLEPWAEAAGRQALTGADGDAK